MGRFKLTIEHSKFIEIRDQRVILDFIFGPDGIERWSTVACVKTYGKPITKAITNTDVVLSGGYVTIVDNVTQTPYNISSYFLRFGMKQFCIKNEVLPRDIMSIMSATVADQITQLAFLKEVKY